MSLHFGRGVLKGVSKVSISKDIRRNIIYTNRILNTLYNLKTQNIKQLANGESYVSSKLAESEFDIGLCNNKNHAHILSSNEILIMDILLSWQHLVDETGNTTISFTDIDWMRNRHKKNKDHIQNAHKLYLEVIQSLGSLFFICTSETINTVGGIRNKYKLLNYELKYSGSKVIGLAYNFGRLEVILKEERMVTTFNANIFRFRLNEDMKYKLLRYMTTATYMNQVKKKSFCRTHKSILKGITCAVEAKDDDSSIRYISCYDDIAEKNYIHKYLSRYINRLDEVLSLMKSSRYIKDYLIEPITSKQELITGCGRVEITTNMSRKRHH